MSSPIGPRFEIGGLFSAVRRLYLLAEKVSEAEGVLAIAADDLANLNRQYSSAYQEARRAGLDGALADKMKP